jgi:hypothetical protein
MEQFFKQLDNLDHKEVQIRAEKKMYDDQYQIIQNFPLEDPDIAQTFEECKKQISKYEKQLQELQEQREAIQVVINSVLDDPISIPTSTTKNNPTGYQKWIAVHSQLLEIDSIIISSKINPYMISFTMTQIIKVYNALFQIETKIAFELKDVNNIIDTSYHNNVELEEIYQYIDKLKFVYSNIQKMIQFIQMIPKNELLKERYSEFYQTMDNIMTLKELFHFDLDQFLPSNNARLRDERKEREKQHPFLQSETSGFYGIPIYPNQSFPTNAEIINQIPAVAHENWVEKYRNDEKIGYSVDPAKETFPLNNSFKVVDNIDLDELSNFSDFSDYDELEIEDPDDL